MHLDFEKPGFGSKQSVYSDTWGGHGMPMGSMERTEHSLVRCKQRGIKDSDLELIELVGTRVNKPGGSYEYVLRTKDKERAVEFLKGIIKKLERLSGKAIVVSGDGCTIITAYHKAN
jgi:hypothetical protein